MWSPTMIQLCTMNTRISRPTQIWRVKGCILFSVHYKNGVETLTHILLTMSRAVWACYALVAILFLAPWMVYTIFVFHWPWSVTEGCHMYNCSYGIDISGARPSWMYTTMISGVILGPRCNVDTACNTSNGYYNGSLDDRVGLLNWMLKWCTPMKNGHKLLNGTACFSGDGGDDIGHASNGSIVYCPYRSSCFNMDRSDNRSAFLAFTPVIIIVIYMLVCGIGAVIEKNTRPREAAPLLEAYQHTDHSTR